MEKRKNLSEQLNEYSTDEENLCGTNFAIHKNVMVWGGTLIQLSNISSISRYNSWENKEEEYSEKVAKSVSFKEFKTANPIFNYAFWGAIVCFIIALFKSFFYIPCLGLAIWVAYSYFMHSKTIINVPRVKTTRICHRMICITMNSTKKYDFEIPTEEFRNDVMLTLYKRIVDPGNNENGIRFDLKNCNIVNNSVVNGGQVFLGDDNENKVGYTEDDE